MRLVSRIVRLFFLVQCVGCAASREDAARDPGADRASRAFTLRADDNYCIRTHAVLRGGDGSLTCLVRASAKSDEAHAGPVRSKVLGWRIAPVADVPEELPPLYCGNGTGSLSAVLVGDHLCVSVEQRGRIEIWALEHGTDSWQLLHSTRGPRFFTSPRLVGSDDSRLALFAFDLAEFPGSVVEEFMLEKDHLPGLILSGIRETYLTEVYLTDGAYDSSRVLWLAGIRMRWASTQALVRVFSLAPDGLLLQCTGLSISGFRTVEAGEQRTWAPQLCISRNTPHFARHIEAEHAPSFFEVACVNREKSSLDMRTLTQLADSNPPVAHDISPHSLGGVTLTWMDLTADGTAVIINAVTFDEELVEVRRRSMRFGYQDKTHGVSVGSSRHFEVLDGWAVICDPDRMVVYAIPRE
ncbi:MAG: hypothetical protein HUU15_18055 [Candidatus Brocadiae bacterium]|nr:hypothetical protein [Candidatus Brocadiia bacterium]